MGIGHFCGVNHVFFGGVFHSEGYIVEKAVVKEYCLLVHVAYYSAQVGNPEVAHINAVDGYAPARNVMIARY